MLKEHEGDQDENKLECPGFQPKYFWAFCALMLWKLGGMEVIKHEYIEKFDLDNMPEVIYDHDKAVWIMKFKKGQMPVIVVPGKKIRKRMLKGSLS